MAYPPHAARLGGLARAKKLSAKRRMEISKRASAALARKMAEQKAKAEAATA